MSASVLLLSEEIWEIILQFGTYELSFLCRLEQTSTFFYKLIQSQKLWNYLFAQHLQFLKASLPQNEQGHDWFKHHPFFGFCSSRQALSKTLTSFYRENQESSSQFFKSNNNHEEIYIACVGADKVGTSSLIQNFLTKKPASSQSQVALDNIVFKKSVFYENCASTLVFFDFKLNLKNIEKAWEKAQCIVLVCSLVDASSVEHVNAVISAIVQSKNLKHIREIPCVLLGTKMDIKADVKQVKVKSRDSGNDKLVRVPKSVLQSLANHHGIPFYQCSAETGQNVDEAIKHLVMNYMKYCAHQSGDNGSNGGSSSEVGDKFEANNDDAIYQVNVQQLEQGTSAPCSVM